MCVRSLQVASGTRSPVMASAAPRPGGGGSSAMRDVTPPALMEEVSPVLARPSPRLDAVSRFVLSFFVDPAPSEQGVVLVRPRGVATGPVMTRHSVRFRYFEERSELVVPDLEDTAEVVSRFPEVGFDRVPGGVAGRSYKVHTYLGGGKYGKVFQATPSDGSTECVVKTVYPEFDSDLLPRGVNQGGAVAAAKRREWANLHGSVLLEGYISIAAGVLGAGVPTHSVSMCRAESRSADAGLVGCAMVADLFHCSISNAVRDGLIALGRGRHHQFTYNGDYLPILRLVDTVHQAGIVHRDLNGGNILVRFGVRGGEPMYRLSDFGLAFVVDMMRPDLQDDFNLLRAFDFVFITLLLAYLLTFGSPVDASVDWAAVQRDLVYQLRVWAPRARDDPDTPGFDLPVKFIDQILRSASRTEQFVPATAWTTGPHPVEVPLTGPIRVRYIAEYQLKTFYPETDIAALHCLVASYPDAQLRAIGPSGMRLRTLYGEEARARSADVANTFAVEFANVRRVCRAMQRAKPGILNAYDVQ